MQLKNLILKPMGVLCFLAAFSCNDNVTNDIEDIEESLSEDVETLADGTVFPKESIEEIEARILQQMQNHGTLKKASYWNRIPHFVGVLSSKESCPGGQYIEYFMDCQDDEPAKNDKCDTQYYKDDCYKSEGLKVDGRGNVTWVVCIVDANKYKFRSMKYGYAIFDLSHIQYLNSAAEVFVHSDDEDNGNANNYLSPTYGFEKNKGSDYMPTQRKMRNTEFWLYYFAPDSKSNYKLPNLGFEYDVFGNFDCCDYKNQNILITDSEDHKCNNYINIYKPESGYPKTLEGADRYMLYCENDGQGFDYNRVIVNTGSHIKFAIQSSKVYRY